MARSYRGAGVIRWGAQDGKDGVNYLIMGWWSESVHYKLTDAGIPVVKVEDHSPDGFSVYKLTALQSTLGVFVASEWEKVKSADFIYMQEAYIEKLYASQAKIAGFDIIGDTLKSNFTRTVDNEDENFEGPYTWTETSTGSVSISPSNVEVSEGLKVLFDNGENGQILKEVLYGSDGLKIVQTISSDNGFVHEQKLEVRVDGIYKDGTKIL